MNIAVKVFLAITFCTFFIVPANASENSLAGRSYSGKYDDYSVTIEFINDTEASFDGLDESRGLEYEYSAETGIVKAWVTSRPEPKELEAKIDGDSLLLISCWAIDEQIVLDRVDGNSSIVNYQSNSFIDGVKGVFLNLLHKLGKFMPFLLIAIYILALLLSSCTECIIVYTWKDMLLLLITFGIGLFFAHNGEFEEKFFITCIPFVLSVIISIYANLGQSIPKCIFYSVISILTKFMLVIIAPVLIFGLLRANISGEKDERYKDGTKGNERSKNVRIAFMLILLLIAPLIKGKKSDREEGLNSLPDL